MSSYFCAPYEIAEVLHSRRGIELFRHDQRLGFQIERHRCVSARRGARRPYAAFGRLQSRNRIYYSFQMLRRGPAAPADNAYTVVGDEVPVVVRQFLGCELVDSPAAFILR